MPEREIRCRALRFRGFTLESIDLLLKIHSLRNIKNDVLKEQQWLKKDIKVPYSTCSYSKEDLASYADKISNTPNNCSPLRSPQYILASDLATLAGTGWLNFSIISGIVDSLNRKSQDTVAEILNNVILVKEDDFPEYLNRNIKYGVKYLVLVATVGKTKSNEVFVSKPGNPGNHWTLVYVDLTVNKWYHIDTYCWGMPKYLKTALAPFVTAIYQHGNMTPNLVRGIVQAHVQSMGSSHSCSKACLKNIPMQACGNVCGVAAAILGGIATAAPALWHNVFLNQNTDLPATLKWFVSPTAHSDFLRCSLISWLLSDSISVFRLGIHEERVGPPLCARNVPFRTHFLGEVIISDDECADGKEYVREKMDTKGESTLDLEERKQIPTSESNKFKEEANAGWIKVEYGKMKKEIETQRK